MLTRCKTGMVIVTNRTFFQTANAKKTLLGHLIRHWEERYTAAGTWEDWKAVADGTALLPNDAHLKERRLFEAKPAQGPQKKALPVRVALQNRDINVERALPQTTHSRKSRITLVPSSPVGRRNPSRKSVQRLGDRERSASPRRSSRRTTSMRAWGQDGDRHCMKQVDGTRKTNLARRSRSPSEADGSTASRAIFVDDDSDDEDDVSGLLLKRMAWLNIVEKDSPEEGRGRAWW